MVIYADVVMGLNFCVDFLLLCASNRYSGHGYGAKRAALAAAVGSVYALVCLIWQHPLLKKGICHLVSLSVMAVIAYGVSKSALRRGILFVLLSMTLGGAVSVMQTDSFWGIVVSCGCVAGLCMAGFRRPQAGVVPVQLRYADKRLEINALHDTGNNLSDPLTGQPVLIVDCGVARYLTGLSRQELEDPVSSMGKLSGLRLIPYKTVGNPGGFLLGLKLSDVKIGGVTGSRLVAFAPGKLSEDGEYEGLTGGAL